MSSRKVLLLAGEESGVLYAKGIAEALRTRLPDVEIRGYADYGFKTHDLAVFGFTAVALKIFYFLRVKRTMERVIDAWRPDVVCTVDYPGMNLKLARYAKERGIRTVHVVAPQVWAWKRGRIPKIEASVDRLCCFFPFEPAYFKPGFATFVGHPLATAFARLTRAEPPPASRRRIVALLPGSRAGEIQLILPTLLAAARRIAGADFVIPAASARAEAEIRRLVEKADLPDVRVQTGGARELLLRADCAAVASGTATLEAALARCPTVLVYRVGRFFAILARRLITGTRYVGLANIVWDKCRVGEGSEPPMPELLQEDFTAEAVAARLNAWLGDPGEHAKAVARLTAALKPLSEENDSPLAKIAAFLV